MEKRVPVHSPNCSYVCIVLEPGPRHISLTKGFPLPHCSHPFQCSKAEVVRSALQHAK